MSSLDLKMFSCGVHDIQEHNKCLHVDVGIRFPAAVKAMSIAVFIDVIFALSIRVKQRRCVCASTTAMLLCIYEYWKTYAEAFLCLTLVLPSHVHAALQLAKPLLLHSV